jgi:hypothetical protein
MCKEYYHYYLTPTCEECQVKTRIYVLQLRCRKFHYTNCREVCDKYTSIGSRTVAIAYKCWKRYAFFLDLNKRGGGSLMFFFFCQGKYTV